MFLHQLSRLHLEWGRAMQKRGTEKNWGTGSSPCRRRAHDQIEKGGVRAVLQENGGGEAFVVYVFRATTEIDPALRFTCTRGYQWGRLRGAGEIEKRNFTGLAIVGRMK